MAADATNGKSDGWEFGAIVGQRGMAKADKVLSTSSAKDYRLQEKRCMYGTYAFCDSAKFDSGSRVFDEVDKIVEVCNLLDIGIADFPVLK